MEYPDYVPPKPVRSMSDMLKGYVVQVPTKPKRGGINSPITEQRAIAAKILGYTIGRVCGMTKGWTGDQLYRLNVKAQSFTANPPALWEKEYKKLKLIYGGTHGNETANASVGQKRRTRKPQEGQGVLFQTREEGSQSKVGHKEGESFKK